MPEPKRQALIHEPFQALWYRRTIRTWSLTDVCQHGCTAKIADGIGISLSLIYQAIFVHSKYSVIYSEWINRILRPAISARHLDAHPLCEWFCYKQKWRRYLSNWAFQSENDKNEHRGDSANQLESIFCCLSGGYVSIVFLISDDVSTLHEVWLVDWWISLSPVVGPLQYQVSICLFGNNSNNNWFENNCCLEGGH